MGKKSDLYESEQVNKRHRHKSKKLEKREKKRKNKKKNKKVKGEKRNLIKYIKKSFKEHKKEIDTIKLFEHCFDLQEIEKQVQKILSFNKEAATEIPELFRIMEEEKKEINLAGLEDKDVQKYLLKLMKNLKMYPSPKNPFAFRINLLFKQLDPKIKFTSNSDDIIPQCLSSFYLLVKAIFEYVNYKQITQQEVKADNSDDSQSDSDSELQELSNQSDDSNEEDVQKNKAKKNEREKLEMDYEYELMEEKLGKNSELINKAFNKIMQEDQKKINTNDQEEEELVGPPIPNFLQNTMLLIGNGDTSNNYTNYEQKSQKKDAFSNLIERTSFNKKTLPTTAPKPKLEPVNKESYDRLIAYERERMQLLSEEMEEYESSHRRTTLMEEHQNKRKLDKEKAGNRNDITRDFDRERDMNIGRIDSKRALSIMQDQKGLKGRFEAKEKYIGY
jgi:hypothetical protein